MKRKDLDAQRAASKQERAKQLADLRKELSSVMLKKEKAGSKNVKTAKMLRRSIAQIATIQREKDMMQEVKEEK